jgi:hypothetical protein
VRKGQSYFSFLTEPHSRFAVKSTLGESNPISNVPRLSSVIIKKMKQALASKLVHPKCKTFKLLWPQKWWPETTEQELAARQAQAQAQGQAPLATPPEASTAQAPLQPQPPPPHEPPTPPSAWLVPGAETPVGTPQHGGDPLGVHIPSEVRERALLAPP